MHSMLDMMHHINITIRIVIVRPPDVAMRANQ